MRIAILGGSFDPPHFGHLLVARQTREIIGLDEVWLMPYFAHSWDPVVSPVADRLAMARLIAEPGLAVCDLESSRRGKSYTIDSVRELKARYPHEFFWIIGSDVLPEFSRWKDAALLTKEVAFLVFPRNGYPIPGVLPPGFTGVGSGDLVTSNLSSTIVRNRLIKGLSVVGLIPEAVIDYLEKHKLYR